MMDIQTFLNELLTVVIIPLILILGKYAINLLNAKVEEIKVNKQIKDNKYTQEYIDKIEETLIRCIDTTTETFVKELKKNGTFTKDNWEIAFNKTKESFLTLLTEEKLNYVESIYNDVDKYIEVTIEHYLGSQVNKNKE